MDIPHKSIQTKQPNTLTDAIHILTQMQSDDDIEVLNAVMQFSMLLSIASEESFLTLPIDHTITTLMYCVGRSLPDIGLYAIMCLNHILDTVPNSSHLLVSQGGVGVLCRLLLNLEYIDMAEHAVKCLERIAHDTPSALVREGVFPVMINILDFFEESTQKKIMATSVIISKAISTEEILNNNILPSLPEMSNLLVYRGLGNV